MKFQPQQRVPRIKSVIISTSRTAVLLLSVWLLAPAAPLMADSTREETPSRAGQHDPSFTLSLALQHFYNQEYDKAEQFFEKYLEMVGPEEVAYRYLAQIQLQKENLDGAKTWLSKALEADPNSLASLSLLADIYVFEKEYEKATPVYEKIIELEPLNEEALFALAQIYMLQNDGRKSIIYYKKLEVATEKQSNNRFYLYKAYSHLAGYYYNSQNYAKAMEYYEKIEQLNPEDINSRYILAELYKVNGRFQESARIMIEILPRINESGEPTVLESLCETLYILNDYRLKPYLARYFGLKGNKNALMRGFLFEMENNPKAAEKYFIQTLQKNSGRLSARIGLYRVYQKAGLTDEAQNQAYRVILAAQDVGALELSRTYTNALFDSFDEPTRNSGFQKEYFENDTLSDKEKIHSLIDTAFKYIEIYNAHARTLESKERNQAAISYYKESLRHLNRAYFWVEKLAPETDAEEITDSKESAQSSETDDEKQTPSEDSEATDEEELDQEQERYEALLDLIDDRKYRTIMSLVWLMHAEEKPPIAQIDSLLEEVIEIAPEEPQARFVAGLIHYNFAKKEKMQERLVTSEKHLTDAVALYEKLARNGKAHPNYYYYLGVVKQELDKFDETVSLLEQAIELDPFNSIFLNYLGYMYSIYDTNLDKAYEYVKRALDDSPEEAMYIDTLGWIYFKMGKYDEALGQLLVAHTIARKAKLKDPVLAYHLAETYFKLNNRHLAKKYYLETLENIENASEPLNQTYIQQQILSIGGTQEEIDNSLKRVPQAQ